jgi:hypothetical protein
MTRKIIVVLCTAMMLSISACNMPTKAVPTIAQNEVMTVVAGQLTEIAKKTALSPRTPTAQLLASATIEPKVVSTPVITPSPAIKSVDFTGNQVYVSYLEGEVMQVSITVPKGIKGDYSAIFNEKPFTCFTYTSKSLDRLICHGAILRSDSSYTFQVFAKDNKTPIYERLVTVPPPPAGYK